MTEPAVPETGPTYPGGANNRAYAFAFQVWMLLFLIVICFGLLNFIASSFRG